MRSRDKLKTYLLFRKTYGDKAFIGQGVGLGAPGYQIILPLDSKITWQKIKNLDKDSDFYSTKLSDYQAWLGEYLKGIVIRPSHAKYGAEIYYLRLFSS